MPPRKEDEIKIPEQVWNRADRSMRESNLGSPFTSREKSELGLPQFPFGGSASPTFLDVPRYGDGGVDSGIQYERDLGSRITNRYTAQTSDILMRNPFGDRMSNTNAYINPSASLDIESWNEYQRQPYQFDSSVGSSGVSRSMLSRLENGLRTEQIVSPYGIAQTSLNPQQVEQREQSREQAQEMGTMPRTPEQQQALLAKMRQTGAGIREGIASSARDSFENRQPSKLYTTPSGAAMAAPTNMFGEPIASWKNIYEKSSAANEAALASIRGTSKPQPVSTMSLPSFGPESSQLARNLGEAGGFGLPSTFYSPQRQAPQSTAPPLGASGGGFMGVTGPWSGSITTPTQYPSRRSQEKQQAAMSQPLNFPRPIGSDVENQYRPRFGRIGML
jgi:hypothetical protein